MSCRWRTLQGVLLPMSMVPCILKQIAERFVGPRGREAETGTLGSLIIFFNLLFISQWCMKIYYHGWLISPAFHSLSFNGPIWHMLLLLCDTLFQSWMQCHFCKVKGSLNFHLFPVLCHFCQNGWKAFLARIGGWQSYHQFHSFVAEISAFFFHRYPMLTYSLGISFGYQGDIRWKFNNTFFFVGVNVFCEGVTDPKLP